jgi:DNA topoisomerase II
LILEGLTLAQSPKATLPSQRRYVLPTYGIKLVSEWHQQTTKAAPKPKAAPKSAAAAKLKAATSKAAAKPKAPPKKKVLADHNSDDERSLEIDAEPDVSMVSEAPQPKAGPAGKKSASEKYTKVRVCSHPVDDVV